MVVGVEVEAEVVVRAKMCRIHSVVVVVVVVVLMMLMCLLLVWLLLVVRGDSGPAVWI